MSFGLEVLKIKEKHLNILILNKKISIYKQKLMSRFYFDCLSI